MNSDKPAKNKDFDARLAPTRKNGDTWSMQVTQISKLEYIRHSLSAFPTQDRMPIRNPLLRKLLWRALSIRLLVRMWRLTRNLEGLARSNVSTMKGMLDLSRTQRPFYNLSQTEMDKHRGLISHSRESLDGLEKDIKGFTESYPRLGARMLVALSGLRQASKYATLIFPQSDPDLLREAERQYHNDELLNLETFINGLQGVR